MLCSQYTTQYCRTFKLHTPPAASDEQIIPGAKCEQRPSLSWTPPSVSRLQNKLVSGPFHSRDVVFNIILRPNVMSQCNNRVRRELTRVTFIFRSPFGHVGILIILVRASHSDASALINDRHPVGPLRVVYYLVMNIYSASVKP